MNVATDDRRRAPRVFVDFEVDFGDSSNFLFASITDLSATGIFVRTTTPEPPGTHLNLRFSPGSSECLELEGEVIWVNAYRPGDNDNLNPGMPSGMSLADVEKRYIERTLSDCNGNRTRAAKVLGIGRNTLNRKIKQYGLT